LRQSPKRPIPPGWAWDNQLAPYSERSTHVEAKFDHRVVRDDDICLIEQLEVVYLTDELGKL
jgi:hypothetical protein